MQSRPRPRRPNSGHLRTSEDAERDLHAGRLLAFRQSLAKLQQASLPAATTLLKLMIDPATPVAVRARCAHYVLDLTRKGIETEEIEMRVTELERVTNQSKGHN